MFRSQICSLRYCGFHQLGCQLDSGPRVSFSADSSSGHLHLPTFCNFAHILHNLCLPFPTRNKGEGYLPENMKQYEGTLSLSVAET